MKPITLSEPPFFSIQGEGQRIGRPTTFVRTYICNLRCAHCDTKGSWGTGKFGDTQYAYNLEDLIASVKRFPTKEICITGGEPMLEGNGEFLSKFIWEMYDRGYETTIETAATVWVGKIIKSPIKLWSISPKYPCQMTGYVNWVKYSVLDQLIQKIKPVNMEIKLLISNERDMLEAKTMLNKLTIKTFNKIIQERIPIVVQPDCEANWTAESYTKELENGFKMESASIPTTTEYLKILKTVSNSLMSSPFFSQMNLIILPQFHKLIGVV